MDRNRLVVLSASVLVLWSLALLHAKPDTSKRAEKKEEKKAAKGEGEGEAFKPIEINNELNAKDTNDPVRNLPAKKYTVKLQKDKTYVIDLVSQDFDAFLRLLDKAGNEVAADDDSGGDLNARIIYAPAATGDHDVVAITLNGQLGKFKLTVREFQLKVKGAGKPQEVGQNGLTINGKITQNDASQIGKLGQVYAVQLKAGQSYTINLDSADMDSYLYLFDGKSKLLAQDDDSGGGLNSRIVHRAQADGVYYLLATSLSGKEMGDFTLKVGKE